MKFNVIRQLPFDKEVDPTSVVEHLGARGVITKAITAALRMPHKGGFTYIMVRKYEEAAYVDQAMDCGFFKGYAKEDSVVFHTQDSAKRVHENIASGAHVFIGTERGMQNLEPMLRNATYSKLTRIICLDTPSTFTINNAVKAKGYFFYSYVPGIPICEKTNDKLIQMERDGTIEGLGLIDVRSIIS